MSDQNHQHEDIQVPFSSIAAFIRKHVHDLRNSLNSCNLEVAYLKECIEDPELSDCLVKIQSEIHQVESDLRDLSKKVSTPYPDALPTSSKLLLILWQEAQATMPEGAAVSMHVSGAEVKLTMDVDDYSAIIAELLKNSAQYGSRDCKLELKVDSSGLEHVTLYEETVSKKVDTQGWGVKPFLKGPVGNRGLGLFMASRLVKANGGKMDFRYNPELQSLSTEIRFPVAK